MNRECPENVFSEKEWTSQNRECPENVFSEKEWTSPGYLAILWSIQQTPEYNMDVKTRGYLERKYAPKYKNKFSSKTA